jgi:hypothetical protein
VARVRQAIMPAWWARHSPRARRDEEHLVREAIVQAQIRRRRLMTECDLEIRRLERMLP